MKKHLLVFRFSALGDVAMTVPVIRAVLEQNPGLQITFVSTAFVQPLFEGIDRLHFFPADLKGAHQGLGGLYRLYKELKSTHRFDGVADLHEVLRTKVLRNFFRFAGVPVAVLDKGRKEKAELTRIRHKKLRPLPHMTERYAAVFRKLGVLLILPAPQFLVKTKDTNRKWRIGVAPFAKHAEKRYDLERMKDVVHMLHADGDKEFFLFGSREEAAILEEWEKTIPSARSLAGKMHLGAEGEEMRGLDLVISMDSANMHLASLQGVPVVSIWGSTHPFAGFYGWGQDAGNAVQVDLYCRPCSVFGNRTCYRGDLACLAAITPQMIYDRVVQALYKSKPEGGEKAGDLI